ncbi:MAG: carboxypeptidase-like regulatory domain-containing protein, partial [Bacteroidaceae bacterium]|nr:carboxypeptidase-like regulatory domain-containing protein [Bacteroidaceae bacterium]
MKRNYLTAGLMAIVLALPMQAGIVKGTVIDSATKKPVAGVVVSTAGGSIVTTTAADGTYVLEGVEEGNGAIAFNGESYAIESLDVTVTETPLTVNAEVDATVSDRTVASEETQVSREENSLLFDESMLEDEGATSSQSVAYLAGSSDDVFLSASSYVFSPMRFSIRGYDQRDQVTYINGIDFTDTERGRFNYSSLGGLNNATRNKDIVHGLDAPGFGYGSLSGATNINTLAADYAAGSQVGLAYTNRAYNLRAQATYATGLMNNGWAFTGSVVYRWADKGRAEGTSYNSLGYFFAAQKIWNNHSLALTAWNSHTERGQSSASTQEVYDYRGIYYNSYWGYQDGKVRNSRIVQSMDPTVLLNYIWDIDNESSLKVGAAYHYNMYSNSALSFYNAPDPRPDYYRNLPGFQYTNLGVNGPGDVDDPNYG